MNICAKTMKIQFIMYSVRMSDVPHMFISAPAI